MLRFAAVVLFSLFACAFPALADQTHNWRVVEMAGDVRVESQGVSPVSLSPQSEFSSDAWVNTGPNGRAVFVRGQESIIVGPSSRLLLPANIASGAQTTVIQEIGNALFQIGKHSTPHFQVDTPHLAAVVKGTTFTVSVDGAGASVAVTEGAVAVSSPAGGVAELIRPGQTGRVVEGDAAHVRVEKTSPDAIHLDSTTASGTSAEATAETSTETASLSTTISEPVGAIVVDVEAASDGLARNATPGVQASGGAASTNTMEVASLDTDSTSHGKGHGRNTDTETAALPSSDTGSEQTPVITLPGNNGNGTDNSGNSGNGNDGNGNSNSGPGNDSGNDQASNGNGSSNSGPGSSGNPGDSGNGDSGNPGTGNSGNGNSGNSGTGNSGNSGTGNAGNETTDAGNGNSGTGNSGNSGNGNSGNGNSGNSGNGNSGNGNSGNSGNGNNGVLGVVIDVVTGLPVLGGNNGNGNGNGNGG